MKTLFYVILILVLVILLIFDKKINTICRGKGSYVSFALIISVLAVGYFIYNKSDHLILLGKSIEGTQTQTETIEQKPSISKDVSRSEPLTIPAIVRAIGPSVVVIYVYNDRNERSQLGSGFFISNKGYVITNHHVMRNASRAEVKTASGNTYPVRNFISEDETNDLIMVSVDLPSNEVQPLSVSPVIPEVGEKVVVIGSPHGLDQTVSDGIVSAVNRKLRDGSGEYIQITAPISPGSSGGPVVNMKGDVIGVASGTLVRGQNLNFCIPSEKVLKLTPGIGLPLAQIAKADSQSGSRTIRQVWCWTLNDGTVEFTDDPAKVRTGYNPILISLPDGTIDKSKYRDFVFREIGINLDRFDPAVIAQNALKENERRIFYNSFPNKEMGGPLTLGEQQFYYNACNQYYRETYNWALAKKNAAIMKYKYMINELNRYCATLNR